MAYDPSGPRDRSPLLWPANQPRTRVRENARRFKTKLFPALENIRREAKLLEASEVQITTNLPVGSRGTFLIDEGRLADPGIALYFKRKGAPMVFTCDRWDTLAANAHALALSIEAIRGLARWGSSQMTEQAFTGFQALPPVETDWRSVLSIAPALSTNIEFIKTRHRELALKAHPDVGGRHEDMVRLNKALEAAERELGGAA